MRGRTLISVPPHSAWRNYLKLNPTASAGGQLSSNEAVLFPIVDAIVSASNADTKVGIATLRSCYANSPLRTRCVKRYCFGFVKQRSQGQRVYAIDSEASHFAICETCCHRSGFIETHTTCLGRFWIFQTTS